VFFRYLHRQRVVFADLGRAMPRRRGSRRCRARSRGTRSSPSAAVERRTPHGKRDYAILLLLATYGRRAREVAALTLDDVDWTPVPDSHQRAQGRPLDDLPAGHECGRHDCRVPQGTTTRAGPADCSERWLHSHRWRSTSFRVEPVSPASGRGAGSHTSATVRSAAGICPKGYGSQKPDISLPIITDVLT
jgi:hypothetical protein